MRIDLDALSDDNDDDTPTETSAEEVNNAEQAEDRQEPEPHTSRALTPTPERPNKSKNTSGSSTSQKAEPSNVMEYVIKEKLKEEETIDALEELDAVSESNDEEILRQESTGEASNAELCDEKQEQDLQTSRASSPTFAKPIRRKQSIKNAGSQKLASTKVIRYIVDQKVKEEACRKDPLDDVDYLFLSLARTVKRMTPYNQAVAKAKVFNVVSELEIEEIIQERTMDDQTNLTTVSL